MPYIYNSSALLSASVSDNLQPITAPAINRYSLPWGIDLAGSQVSGFNSQHIPLRHLQFIPIKFASTITIDRIGINFPGANGTTDTFTYNLGLYTNNSATNYPDALITNFGDITYEPGVTANGAQQITISQVLNANTTYWLAAGITISGSTDSGVRSPFLSQLQGDFAMYRKRGLAGATSGSPMGYCWAHSFASYSGTLPASVSFAANSFVLGQGLRIVVRRSA